MIYIVGDRHGEYDGFTDWKLPTQSTWTSEDTVIVTGDFRYVMHGENQNPNEKRMLDALAEKTYCIVLYFVMETTKDLTHWKLTRKQPALEHRCG